MILGWSLGGIIGPLVISALIGGGKNYTLGYSVVAIIALVAIVLTALTRIPRTRQNAREGLLGGEAARTT